MAQNPQNQSQKPVQTSLPPTSTLKKFLFYHTLLSNPWLWIHHTRMMPDRRQEKLMKRKENDRTHLDLALYCFVKTLFSYSAQAEGKRIALQSWPPLKPITYYTATSLMRRENGQTLREFAVIANIQAGIPVQNHTPQLLPYLKLSQMSSDHCFRHAIHTQITWPPSNPTGGASSLLLAFRAGTNLALSRPLSTNHWACWGAHAFAEMCFSAEQRPITCLC